MTALDAAESRITLESHVRRCTDLASLTDGDHTACLEAERAIERAECAHEDVERIDANTFQCVSVCGQVL